jgi:hypothetical protein
MLNFKSIRSSEPQIRSNPALRHIGESSGFQKRLSTLLEPTPLPFPTFQIVKENTQPILEKNSHYAWIRPAHLRSQWLVLADGMPLLMADPRQEGRIWSLRVPFDKKTVQKTGPIVLEGAWDAQEHTLWIWDVVVWEKSVVWSTMPYSERWKLVMKTVDEILDCGHPMSDAEVRVPAWTSLEEVSKCLELDSAKSIDFQPEKAGQRRLVFLVRDMDVKFKANNHHERKMVAEGGPKIHNPNLQKRAKELSKSSVPPPPPPQQVQIQPVQAPVEQPQNKPESNQDRPRVGRLRKDTFSKLPDTYRISTVQGEELGLAAIRSLEISKQLREKCKTVDSVLVDILWCEPFQKYEVKRVH